MAAIIRMTLAVLSVATALWGALPFHVAWWRVALGTAAFVAAVIAGVSEGIESVEWYRRFTGRNGS